MQSLLIIFGVLAGIFGFLSGAYLTFYRFKPETKLSKTLTFIIAGAAISLAAFAVAVTIVWPPVM